MEAEEPEQAALAAENVLPSAAEDGEGVAEEEMNDNEMELASLLEDWADADANQLEAAIAAVGMVEGQEQEGQAQDEQAVQEEQAPMAEEGAAADDITAAPIADGEGAAGYEDVDEGDDQLMQDDTQAEAGTGQAAGEEEAEEGQVQQQTAADVAAAGQGGRDEEAARREQRIMASMTEAQLDRYEAFRRSSLPRAKMKKLLQQLLGTAATSDKTLIALCGIGKMFVGDVIEMARHLSAVEGHTGPLLPRHVQRAYQVLDAADRVPHAPGAKRRMFR